ncbi:MAG: helix-hairpin-helix domain-containing protein [Gammaproteobacteria bacterium]|jgi:DNA polymerase (family X)
MATPLNRRVADQLREIGDALQVQGANEFRVSAYRRAAATVEQLPGDLDALIQEQGMEGLEGLPGIGAGIARAIYEIVATGRSSRLDRLHGALDPERLFQAVPGVGPALAERLHHALQVDTLEGLEIAAHDGRLEDVEGVGARRAAAIRAALEGMLGRRRSRPPRESDPPVAVLLEVDRRYRELSEQGRLPTIAPRRFNPGGGAWLPVWHTQRDRWHFTALYSNTARAHELGRTRDWVVIYFHDDRHQEGQYTVVTEHQGPLKGRRVVRGRELECRDYYRAE